MIHPSGIMNTKSMVILAIVAVAAVAVVGGIVLFGQSDDDDKKTYAIDGSLNVYGNADRDYKIDNEDLQIVKDIVAGEKSFADYPFADADYNGTVNDADVELVQKILDKEPCTITHVNIKKTAGEYISQTSWPVKSAIATGSSNNLMLFTLAGINDKIHGICYSSTPDYTLFPTYEKVERLGTKSTAISLDAANDTIKQYKVTALISDYTDSTISNESEFEDNGIDVIRISAAVVDPDKYASQLLLIGFLFQSETKAMEFSEWNTKVLKDIASKVSTIEKKKTVITCNSAASSKGVWVSAGASDYRDVVEAAGGVYAITDDYDVQSISGYTSGAYFAEGDTWIYNLNPDAIVSIRVSDWYSGSLDIVKKYEESVGLFKQTKAYEDGYVSVITGDAPISIRVAYAAAMMYPDVFSIEWANELNEEAFEKFYPVDIDFKGKTFAITSEDYEAAKEKA